MAFLREYAVNFCGDMQIGLKSSAALCPGVDDETISLAVMASLKTAEATTRASKAFIAARAVHVNVTPAPDTLHDRRGILRVLKQFGEVIMFRSLKV